MDHESRGGEAADTVLNNMDPSKLEKLNQRFTRVSGAPVPSPLPPGLSAGAALLE